MRYLAALIAAQHESVVFAQAYQEQLAQRRAATSAIVDRAAERGELAPDADREQLLDGIVLEWLLVRRRPLADDFPERLVDQLLGGFGVGDSLSWRHGKR